MTKRSRISLHLSGAFLTLFLPAHSLVHAQTPVPVVIPNPPVVSPAAGHELSTLQTRAAELKAAISAYAADPTLANLSLLDSARSDYDTAVTAARNANPAAFFNNAASTSLGPATSRYLALAANHAAFIASEPASLTFEGFIPNGGLDGGVISMGSGSILDLRGGLNPDNSYSLVFDDNLSYDDILLNNMVAPFAIATSYGGAIFDQGGTLSLNQVLFTNNSAYANTNINGVNNSGNASGTTGTESYGGAIYSLGGTINLSNIDFYSNDASGGSTAKGTAAGYIATAMALSQGYGGAIYLDSGFMSIGNSSFSFNAAFAYSEASAYNAAQAAGLALGGAIFHKGGKVALHDVTFTQNSATADITSNSINSGADAEASGGAIYQGTGTLSLRQVTFTGNEANAEATARNGNEATASTNTNSYAIGGAIFNKGGVLNLFNVDFSTNKALSSSLSYAEKDSSANAESRGGAFYNDSGTLAFTNGSFLNNVASANADNNAHAHGGAFYTKNGTLDLFNVTFSGNYAQAYSESFVEEFNPVTADSRNSAFGGAIYSKDSAFNLTNVSISNNYAKAEASATANGSYYSFPIASAYSETQAHGGAAYHEGGAMSFSNASYSSNYARAVSDSIAYGDTGIATDVDSIAFAYARGGAIYHNGGLLSLSNATFSNNYAYASASASASMDVSANIEARAFAYGGAIFTSGATLNLTNVTFSNNHAEAVGTTSAEARGGAIYSLNNAINFTTSSGKTSLFTGNTTNGVASSIYFNGGSFDILTQTNALLDMRDPMSRENTVSNLPITKTGDGAWALGGSNTFLGNNTTFAVNGGTLYLYAANEVDNSVRDINGDVVTAAQVVAGSLQLTGASSSFSLGSGASLVAGGANSITTGGTITFADGSTIRGGSASQFLGGVDPARKELGNTTQLTLNATGGISLNGTVHLGALDAVDVFTLTGLLTGSGGINKVGAGTVVLANANTFLGNSSISAGTLRVTNASGSATGSASLAVKNGGTLAGNGKITGIVTVENGGTISPGLSPGTIGLGELVLGPSGHVAFELGTPNVIGGPTNDLIDVVQNLEGSGSSGNLTLNGGIVDILSLGGLGTYTLIAWDGGLAHNATPTIGLWQAGYFFDGGIVVNETLKEVQLTVTTDGLQFWDGNGTSADGILTGGTGTWNFTDARWTDSDGSAANLTWQDGYGAVFGGLSGGTVTLNDNVSLGVQGLHFATSGYTLTGTGAFTISDSGTLLIINDGLTATIDNLITGSGGIEKNGLGEIIFTRDNTYNGDTVIRYGTLSTRNLANSSVILEGGSFSPGGMGTATSIQVASLSLDGGSLIFDLGGGGTDHIEVLDGLAQLNAATLFAFNSTGNQSGLYALISGLDSGWDLSLLQKSGLAGDTGYFLLSNDGSELFYRTYFGEWIGGEILQNSLPVATPLNANFQVTGNVRTGTFTESNTVNALRFAPGSHLQVYNNLTVTSGNFTTQGGKATVEGGTVLVPGDFNKLGPGILDARSNFVVAGDSSIHSGALAVNGTFQTGQLHVLGGSTLMGSGLVIGNVHNSGTVAPGNTIGTLSVRGNYTQARSGTLQVEAASLSNHDILVVSGHARLGGTLELKSLGYKPKFGDQITFLKAGKITGKFDEILVPQPKLNRGRFLNLGNTGALLIAPASYTLVAETPNETRLAKALDRWIGVAEGDIGKVTLALDLLREDQYAQAFAAISPAYYEGALSTGIELSHNHSQLLHQQLNARRLADRPANVPPMPAPVSGKGTKAIAPQIQPTSDDLRWSAWVQGSGLFSKGGLSLTPGEEFESGTFLVGADYLLSDHFAIGVFASYQEGWGNYDSGGDIDLDATRFGAYATYDQGGFYANAAIGGGQTRFDIERPIRWAYLDRTTSSSPDGNEFFTSLSTGYDLKRGNWSFGPQASLQYSRLSLKNIVEGGAGSLNLRLQDAEIESLRSYLGGRIAYTIQVNESFAIIPEVRAFWQHEFLEGGSVKARLNGGDGPAFTHTFSDPDKDSFYLGAGIGFQMGTRVYANIYYNLDLARREEENHTISISATIKF